MPSLTRSHLDRLSKCSLLAHQLGTSRHLLSETEQLWSRNPCEGKEWVNDALYKWYLPKLWEEHRVHIKSFHQRFRSTHQHNDLDEESVGLIMELIANDFRKFVLGAIQNAASAAAHKDEPTQKQEEESKDHDMVELMLDQVVKACLKKDRSRYFNRQLNDRRKGEPAMPRLAETFDNLRGQKRKHDDVSDQGRSHYRHGWLGLS
jgi:hypothetical protein